MNKGVESRKRKEASERYKQQSISSSPSEEDSAEARKGVSGQMQANDAADIALAAVDELADQAAELETLKDEFEASKAELEAARAELASVQAELQGTKSELANAKDQLLRTAAEFQNFKRRTEDEKSTLVEVGKSVVIERLLDVLDDLRRSLDAAATVNEKQVGEAAPAYTALKEGVDLVYRKFSDELSRLGVEPIEAVGQPFDENRHEAMMQQEVEGAESGTVVEEMQKGYLMNGRVIRHSKVIVAA